MSATRGRLLATALLAALPIGGCGEEPGGAGNQRGAAPKAAPAKASWTPDEMAADPEGYLVWAEAQLAAQIANRNANVAAIAKRRGDLAKRKEEFGANLTDLQNVESRLATALRKAEEEDRLPVRMGGRVFEREKARTILAELKRQIETRSPLTNSYDEALAKLDAIAAGQKGDVERLTALREQVGVDLETVRISHGVAELSKLRTTEAEISHYAKIVGSVAEETAGALPSAPPPVDLDKLLE